MQSSNVPEKCPVCQDRYLLDSRAVPGRDALENHCELCGNYEVTRTFAVAARTGIPADDRKCLTAHVRQQSARGLRTVLDSRNWQGMVEAHRHTTVGQKIRLLIDHVARNSPGLGDGVLLRRDCDYPLIDAESPTEMLTLITHLQKDGTFDPTGGSTCILTVRAWQNLEGATGKPQPGRVFVAMWFDDTMKPVYDEGFEKAILDCKMDPVRIDRITPRDKICDRILAEIRMAQIVVADFTGFRSGVFFEAGFAKGLGRDVIWTCKTDASDELSKHFDTRQYPHIKWKDAADLREQLRDRIRAMVVATG